MAWHLAALLLVAANLSSSVKGLSVKSKREANSLFDSDLFVFSSGPFSDASKSFQGFLPIIMEATVGGWGKTARCFWSKLAKVSAHSI